MLRKLILTVAAGALVAAPAAAQAAEAAPARVASPVAETEGLNQGLILLLGGVTLGLLVLIFSDGADHDTTPTSP
jgi:hypothetical protein